MKAWKRIIEDSILIEPEAPNIEVTCGTNCENKMVTLKYGSPDFDNMTLLHYIDADNVLLRQEVIFPGNSRQTV